MIDAGPQAPQLAANQIKLNFVERPSAGRSPKINFAPGISPPSSDARGKVQQLRDHLQIRRRIGLGRNSLSDCRKRRDPALAYFAWQAHRLQRRINLERQGLVVPVHEMGVAADAVEGMFGGVVIVPGSVRIAVVSHVRNDPSSQSKRSLSACAVAAFERGSRMAPLRPRKPVVDYRLSRTSCPHGTEIIVGGASCMFSCCLRVVGFFLLTSGAAYAQTAIEGTVRNSTGQPLPNASVSLQHQDSGTTLTTVSDSDGKFRFSAVEAGAYTLQAEAANYFKTAYEFVLRPRQPISLNIELQAKETLRQKVEVQANYLTIDPEKTGSSYTFTRQDLERLPEPLIESTNDLVNNLMPGASDSHDSFLAVRGTEFSLHEFVNGVSFLDNAQPQFSPGVSPQIFETVDLMTGGFTPEYGNRFGGVLDITTRSGADLGGHGDVNFRGASVENYDFNADYGGQAGRLGYYFFVDGFTSGRYLDPPEPKQLFDFGKGSRATAQFDWRARNNDSIKLLLMGSGTNFQQPNITDDQAVGRDAQRHLRQYTAILGWLHTFSPQTLLHTSIYERTSSDQVLPTSDLVTPLSSASRAAFTLGVKSDLSHSWRGHFFKAGIDVVRLREGESFFFDGRGDPDVFPSFQGWGRGGQASFYVQDHFSPIRNLTVDLGLRYDHFDLVDADQQASPRVGLAYHLTKTKSVIHAA